MSPEVMPQCLQLTIYCTDDVISSYMSRVGVANAAKGTDLRKFLAFLVVSTEITDEIRATVGISQMYR